MIRAATVRPVTHRRKHPGANLRAPTCCFNKAQISEPPLGQTARGRAPQLHRLPLPGLRPRARDPAALRLDLTGRLKVQHFRSPLKLKPGGASITHSPGLHHRQTNMHTPGESLHPEAVTAGRRDATPAMTIRRTSGLMIERVGQTAGAGRPECESGGSWNIEGGRV